MIEVIVAQVITLSALSWLIVDMFTAKAAAGEGRPSSDTST